MTTTVPISKDLDLYFLGRNGSGRLCGLAIFRFKYFLEIRPITSKGVTGRCSVSIPIEQVGEFIEAFQVAARDLPPSSSNQVPQPAQAAVPATVDQLIAQFGAWGEYPRHPRSDWQYLVANGDTQRGYWEHVAACVEQEDDDQRPSADVGKLGS